MRTNLSQMLLAGSVALTATLFASTGASAAGLGKFCGGIANIPCDYGLFCDQRRCGAGDIGGKCAKIPQICTKEFRPVCGCDGKTYSNDCMRRAAGVSKKHNGRCKS